MQLATHLSGEPRELLRCKSAQQPKLHDTLQSSPDETIVQRGFFGYNTAASSDRSDHIRQHALRDDTEDQVLLLRTVRDLETKLNMAREKLQAQARNRVRLPDPSAIANQDDSSSLEMKPLHGIDLRGETIDLPVPNFKMTKQDYLDLVDLYFYTQRGRYSAESPDHSPSVVVEDEYGSQLSADRRPTGIDAAVVEWNDQEDDSAMQQVQKILKEKKLQEIGMMEAFVDLLLDDDSSTKAIFLAYKQLPEPGVSYLPRGVIRLFLQRMSTPAIRSKNACLRYLSLIDDMQAARLPITVFEWSSAIYLAGRSFAAVTERDVAASFRLWKDMENAAGVQSTHVTFNILFDIAVRSGKFALAETVLQEMHSRSLRLNRMGRVSLIYYYGSKANGDGVRMAYRDFVEAGEIVDTFVLNCVMVSLIRAGEPIAAEQIFERMRRWAGRPRVDLELEGQQGSDFRYPPPGSVQVDQDMASNHLGRILWRAKHLSDVLPESHERLQQSMPLAPDAITFRNLIKHHANTSEDLDRVSVLILEMTETFQIPFTTPFFKILLKGFALHGGSKRESAKWTTQRLDLVWESCQKSLHATLSRNPPEASSSISITLPTIDDIHDAEAAESMLVEATSRPRRVANAKRRANKWGTFLRDFTSPDGRTTRAAWPEAIDTYNSPVVPDVLPQDPDDPDESKEEILSGQALLEIEEPPDPRGVYLNKGLAMWVLRAFTKCSGSRIKLEEVWFQIRRFFKPLDIKDRDIVVKCLRSCLARCDRKHIRF